MAAVGRKVARPRGEFRRVLRGSALGQLRRASRKRGLGRRLRRPNWKRAKFKTVSKKKVADNFAATANVEIRAGIHTADSASKTIAEAGRLWLETGDKAGLERSTLAAYRQHLKLHIQPYLGNVKLSQLSAPMVREFVEDKLARGDMPERAPSLSRGLARWSARSESRCRPCSAMRRSAGSSRATWSVIFGRHAPAASSGKPSVAEKGKLKVGVDIPTREEIKAIVEAAKGRWRPVLLTAIFTGLRSSELRGLRWADVDLDKRELHVRQRADRYSAIGKPKSELGERTVPLTPVVVNALCEWKLACPKSAAELVFPSTGGLVEHHKNIVERGLIPTLVAGGVTVEEEGPTARCSSTSSTRACTPCATSMPHGASTAAL